MLVPMSPTSSVFLLIETRERPMHVGALELFRPPDGADGPDLTSMLTEAMASTEVAPIFHKRARRSITSLGQWGWEEDDAFDLEHHVRRNALPAPARVRELLTLCSQLHSALLDRHRPLWELNLIEGLHGGRFAVYFKAHHSLVDGVSALRTLSSMLSIDPNDVGMPPFWAPRPTVLDQHGDDSTHHVSAGVTRHARSILWDVAGVVPVVVRSIDRGLGEHGGCLSFSAPRSMFNVPVTAARRFAAQSWPIARLKQIGKAAEATVNDVVLAMCSGALRNYLLAMNALPDAPLVAMVPVSLHGKDSGRGDGSGNNVAAVMCNLATTFHDPAHRLATVQRSMAEGKEALHEMTPLQTLVMTGLGMSPLAVYPLLHLDGRARPPFNLIISNVPGPGQDMYWNGWQLDGLYPMSVVLDGQALNITVTSHAKEIAFGLTGCRRSVPHLQWLLGYLDDELSALEVALGV